MLVVLLLGIIVFLLLLAFCLCCFSRRLSDLEEKERGIRVTDAVKILRKRYGREKEL